MITIFKRRTNGLMLLLTAAVLFLFNQCDDPASLSALIISDADPEVTESFETILENTGLFDADKLSGGSPSFDKYDVIVLHLTTDNWTEKTKSAFTSYVKSGGGVVILGNTISAMSAWSGFEEISGIELSGPLKRTSEKFDYQLVNSKKEHPVLEGLHSKWMHTDDFMLFNSAGMKSEVEVLSTAWADTLQGGDGTHVPVIASMNSGEGRVFHTTLSAGVSKDDHASIQCVGFITVLQRGSEWAATGVVSQEVTIDFPNSVSTHQWPDFQSLDLDEILAKASAYEMGKSKKYLDDFTRRVRTSDGKVETYAMFEDMILNFLASEATLDSKRYMCRELSWIGGEKSIAALEKLINDKDLSESASYALQRLRM